MTALVEHRRGSLPTGSSLDQGPLEEAPTVWGWEEPAGEEPALRPEAGNLDRWLDLNA